MSLSAFFFFSLSGVCCCRMSLYVVITWTQLTFQLHQLRRLKKNQISKWSKRITQYGQTDWTSKVIHDYTEGRTSPSRLSGRIHLKLKLDGRSLRTCSFAAFAPSTPILRNDVWADSVEVFCGLLSSTSTQLCQDARRWTLVQVREEASCLCLLACTWYRCA